MGIRARACMDTQGPGKPQAPLGANVTDLTPARASAIYPENDSQHA